MDRNTNQRRAIREAMEAAGRPLSPMELLEAAKAHAPKLGIATVYRTVKSLVEEGWLKTVELPGHPPRYELSHIAHHHHFHCTHCGRVFDVPGCPGDLKGLAPAGFSVERHDIVLYGRCPECGGGKSPRRKTGGAAHGHDHSH